MNEWLIELKLYLTPVMLNNYNKDDIAQETDNVMFDCVSLSGNPMVMFTELSNQINKIKGQLAQEWQEWLAEQQNLKAELTTLPSQPITQHILIDANLSVRDCQPSSGSRSKWISLKISQLLPSTRTTGPAFELKLE